MRISIITVCLNSEKTIQKCLESVAKQTSISDIEHIVIDGLSTDRTLDIVKNFNHISNFVSEKDKGIYDAMNKGVSISNGNYVAFLNADDFYKDENIIEVIIEKLKKNPTDFLFSNISYLRKNSLEKVSRIHTAKWFKPNLLKWGWMPPHPGTFCSRKVFDFLGGFDDTFLISGDYDFLVRAYVSNQINFQKLNRTSVLMSPNGMSQKSLKNKIILNKEVIRSLKLSGLKGSYGKILSKYFFKLINLT